MKKLLAMKEVGFVKQSCFVQDCVYKDWEGYAPLADMVTAMQTRCNRRQNCRMVQEWLRQET